MKKILILVLTINTITACNNGTNNTDKAPMDMSSNDSAIPADNASDVNLAAAAVTYTGIDAHISASMKMIVDHYLHIKNALTNDNGSEAASGADAMGKAISLVDASFLTAEQKETFDKIKDDLKEHAGHIGKNGNDISQQREHFSMMSEDMLQLVSAFGGGRPLYHDHCPMYQDGKGALWLSESKEIKNPYFGAKMISCGKAEAIIK